MFRDTRPHYRRARARNDPERKLRTARLGCLHAHADAPEASSQKLLVDVAATTALAKTACRNFPRQTLGESICPSGIAADDEEYEKRSTFLRQLLQIPPHKKIVVSVSRLDQAKGIDLAIETLSEMSDDFHLVIIGAGEKDQEKIFRQLAAVKTKKSVEFFQAETDLLQTLLANERVQQDVDRKDYLLQDGVAEMGQFYAAQEFEERPNITFVGAVSQQGGLLVDLAYRGADVFLSCSEAETFGLTVLEALGVHLIPIVGSEIPVFQELYGSSVLGEYMYSASDGLNLVANHPDLVERFKEVSADTVEKGFLSAEQKLVLRKLSLTAKLQQVKPLLPDAAWFRTQINKTNIIMSSVLLGGAASDTEVSTSTGGTSPEGGSTSTSTGGTSPEGGSTSEEDTQLVPVMWDDPRSDSSARRAEEDESERGRGSSEDGSLGSLGGGSNETILDPKRIKRELEEEGGVYFTWEKAAKAQARAYLQTMRSFHNVSPTNDHQIVILGDTGAILGDTGGTDSVGGTNFEKVRSGGGTGGGEDEPILEVRKL